MSRLVLVIVFLVASTASSQGGTVMLRGFPTCKDWLKPWDGDGRDDQLLRRAMEFKNEAWLAGYLSGLASGTGLDTLADDSAWSGRNLWMDKYCSAHPLDPVVTGADKLHDELVERLRARRKQER